MRVPLHFFLLTCALFGCEKPPDQPDVTRKVSTEKSTKQIPANWQTIRVDALFSFRAPPDLKEVDVQGIDSLVGEFVGPTLTLSYDYGRFSNSLSEEEFDGNWTIIDGFRARIARRGNYCGVHFPEVKQAFQAKDPPGVKEPAEEKASREERVLLDEESQRIEKQLGRMKIWNSLTMSIEMDVADAEFCEMIFRTIKFTK